ncbi:major urinary protein 20-like [Lacerta agilis]|uniref:major urinary protein 20-like n=1 Tax=Lacerta agilis TaxID=80427 RepID=UPI001419BF7A|nr:major urinary protein 20-like [Lacerta agilis]
MIQYDKQKRVVFGYSMEPQENGGLVLKIDFPRNGECLRKTIVLHAVKQAEFDSEDGKTTLHIVDTDYETYHIILFRTERTGMLQLFGKEKTVSDEVKEKFKTTAQDLQFDPDAINYVPENDEKTTVHIVDTDYENYHIIHFLMEHMGMLQLYGREQTVSDEVKEKFKTTAQDLQFDPEAINYVTENELCL